MTEVNSHYWELAFSLSSLYDVPFLFPSRDFFAHYGGHPASLSYSFSFSPIAPAVEPFLIPRFIPFSVTREEGGFLLSPFNPCPLFFPPLLVIPLSPPRPLSLHPVSLCRAARSDRATATIILPFPLADGLPRFPAAINPPRGFFFDDWF